MDLYEALDENEKKILQEKINSLNEKELLYTMDQKLELIIDKLYEIEKNN